MGEEVEVGGLGDNAVAEGAGLHDGLAFDHAHSLPHEGLVVLHCQREPLVEEV